MKRASRAGSLSHVTSAEAWTCPTCGREVATPFCEQCGEKRRDPRDLTLRGLVLLVYHSLSAVDGRVLRSFRELVARPGELSVAWVRGQRLARVGPLQLFFLANVAFFALQPLGDVRVFSSTLSSHMHEQDWSELARRLVPARLEALGTTLAEFAPLFDRAAALHAKSFIALMIVPFALLLPLVFRRERRPFVGHVVFAIHLYAFLLVLFCVAVLAIGALRLVGTGGLESRPIDMTVSVAILGACVAYLARATGVFYGARGARRALAVAVLTVAVGAIVLGYRFAVFLITLYTT